MSALSISSELVQRAIAVNIQDANGLLGTRLVTFDFNRQEEPLAGYICKHCHGYSQDSYGPKHDLECKVINSYSEDDLIVVIGWAFISRTSGPLPGIQVDDLRNLQTVAIAQKQRLEGEDEEELAKTWNEGKSIPVSPISVKSDSRIFKF